LSVLYSHLVNWMMVIHTAGPPAGRKWYLQGA